PGSQERQRLVRGQVHRLYDRRLVLGPEPDRRGVRVREQGGALQHADEQLVEVQRLRQRGELAGPAQLELCAPQLVRVGRTPAPAEGEALAPDRDHDRGANDRGGQRDDERSQEAFLEAVTTRRVDNRRPRTCHTTFMPSNAFSLPY